MAASALYWIMDKKIRQRNKGGGYNRACKRLASKSHMSMGAVENSEREIIMEDNMTEVSFDDGEESPNQKKVPKFETQASNLSFRERLVDSWHRFLERTLAPGCYYIGLDYGAALCCGKAYGTDGEEIVTPSQLTIISEKKNDSFGVDIELLVKFGSIFRDAVEIHKVLGKKFVFFRPIHIENSSIRIAIGRRSFIENDTVVLNGSTSEDVVAYRLNIPGDIMQVLRNTNFHVLKDKEHVSSFCRSEPIYPARKLVSWELEEVNGTSNLKINVDDLITNVIPNILSPSEVGNVALVSSSTLIVGGIKIVRGETASFVKITKGTVEKPLVYTTLTLPKGSGTLTLSTEDAKLVVDALKALNDLSSYGFYRGMEMDELYRGKEAIYLKWHRGWSNSK
jgi:hypothetical protein